MPNVSIEYKNTVFCLLYRDKKRLLSLYNTMNGSDSQIHLYEHQSSLNDNIPLRDLYYVVEEYKKLMPPSRLHRRKPLQIPAPHFVVFYNGTAPQPEKKVMRLSELYEVPADSPELELVVTQYNINAGYNEEIKEKCESLQGYMAFVDKVRGKTAEGLDAEHAVREAVNECIAEDILADFFREHKSEVMEMGIFDFDEEEYERVIREEGWEDGLAEGETNGELLTLIKQTCRKLLKNKPIETIAEELEEDSDVIRKICAIAANYAPDYDARKILEEYRNLQQKP